MTATIRKMQINNSRRSLVCFIALFQFLVDLISIANGEEVHESTIAPRMPMPAFRLPTSQTMTLTAMIEASTTNGLQHDCSPCDCRWNLSDAGSLSFVIDCSKRNLTRIPSHLIDLDIDSIDVMLNLSWNQLSENTENWKVCKLSQSAGSGSSSSHSSDDDVVNVNAHDLLMKVRGISLAWNGYRAFPNVFEGCQAHIKDLFLAGNFLRSIDSHTFQGFGNLHTLHGLWVGGKLSSDSFSPLISLTRLELTYEASTISEDLFSHLPGLKTLWLTLPAAQEVPPDFFSYSAQLKELHLNAARLKYLPSDSLHHLTELSILQLELPELRHLQLVFPTISRSKLKQLTITGVLEIGTEMMHQLSSLESLRLVDIRIPLDLSFLLGLSELKILMIVNCFVSSDSLNSIRHLSNLETLFLKQVGLTLMPSGMLSGLISLQHLDLSFNYLDDIDPNFLTSISQTVDTLNLSGNMIKHVNASNFPLMPNLKNLDLSRNLLSRLNLDAFTQTQSLTQLSVSRNFITQIYGDRITATTKGLFPNLSLLDLSNNLLPGILRTIPLDKTEVLDVSGNPLTQSFPIESLEFLAGRIRVEIGNTEVDCDCNLERLVSMGILRGGICLSPQFLNGKPTTDQMLRDACIKGDIIKGDDGGLVSDLIGGPSDNVVNADDNDSEDDIEDDEFWREEEGSIQRTFGPSKVFGKVDGTTFTPVTKVKSEQHQNDLHPEDSIISENQNHGQDNNSDIKTLTATATINSDNPDQVVSLKTDETNSWKLNSSDDLLNSKVNTGGDENINHGNLSSLDLLENNVDDIVNDISNGDKDETSGSFAEVLEGVETNAIGTKASGNLSHIPWVVTICLLVILVGLGYLVYKWNSLTGSHTMVEEGEVSRGDRVVGGKEADGGGDGSRMNNLVKSNNKPVDSNKMVFLESGVVVSTGDIHAVVPL